MKKKELEKMRSLPQPELEKKLSEERDKVQAMRFDLSLGKTSDVKGMKAAKRAVAQLLTIIKKNV